MRSKFCTPLALGLVALAGLALPAAAESFVVECSSNAPGPEAGSMFCNQGKMLEFTSPGPATEMMLTIKAPATHCSDVAYVINSFRGSEAIAVTPRLRAGEGKEVSLGTGWEAGSQFLTVAAIGYVGGCNTGVLGSWGGEVSIAPR
jgi:hypothetical protein